MRLERTVGPATTPISLSEARQWIAIQSGVTDDDTVITALIEEITDDVESYTGRALVTQTWEVTLDEIEISDVIYLPKAPLISVDSIIVTDSNNSPSTVSSSDYQVTNGEMARVALAEDVTSWGDDLRSHDAMVITATFGYTVIPARIKRLMKGLVLHAYATKGLGVMEFASGALMSVPRQYRQMLRNLKLRTTG